MTKFKTASITFALVALTFGLACAQFPMSNFKKSPRLIKESKPASARKNPDTSKSSGTPQPLAIIKIVDSLEIDTSKTLGYIDTTIDKYKNLVVKYLAIQTSADYLSKDPTFANNITAYLSSTDNVVERYIKMLQVQQLKSMTGAVKYNGILVKLHGLDDYLISVKQDYGAISRLMGRSSARNNWFPARTSADSKLIYNMLDSSAVSFGNSFTFMGTADQAAVNPEIVSGYFGPLRISINTLITTTKDTSVAGQSRLRLISGGGNTAITLAFPLYRCDLSSFSFFVHFAPKFIADFPLLGATTITKGTFVGSIDLAPEVMMRVFTGEKNIGFFANFRPSLVYGTSQFMQNLSLNPHTPNFSFGELNAGIFVSANFQISATALVYGSSGSLLRAPVLLTTQIFPGTSKSK